MSGSDAAAPVGYRVADHLHLPGPWEVYGERARRYELHFNGRVLEVVRGPLVVEGYGLRVFEARRDRTGTGFQASTDTSDPAITAVTEAAQRIAVHSDFPTKRVDLPATASPVNLEIVDSKLWDSPTPHLQSYVDALLAPFDSIPNAVPSFGSVRATLSECSIANSAGLRAEYRHTTTALELAIKAFGGPEGAPPGEYWVNANTRRVDPSHAGDPVANWCKFAQDARGAKPPPNGEQPVVLPAEVAAGILPSVLGFRCTGGSRLRELAPAAGSRIGASNLTIYDDGRFPWGPNSAPFDDEGVATGRRTLVAKGLAEELLYNLLHAGAFDVTSTGNGLRGLSYGNREWLRFTHAPGLGATTLVVTPGDGGTDAELAEMAGDGIWLQQLGWASPDPLSGAFGGEIRIGYRIRNGKIAEPVRGGTIGGTVLAPPDSPSLLTSIAGIGSRPKLIDDLSSPTLLVRTLTVAGENAPGTPT
jgi:predicted Zn-dependent protease